MTVTTFNSWVSRLAEITPDPVGDLIAQLSRSIRFGIYAHLHASGANYTAILCDV